MSAPRYVSTLVIVAALVAGSAFAQAPSTPRTADGTVDLNGVWGAAALPPPVKPTESVKFLFPVPGVNPESKDVFHGFDSRQVDARAAAPNKPEYKPDLLERVKYLSDRQGLLDPAFHCRPQGVPRMGAPSQIVQTPGQIVFLYGASNLFRVIPTDGRPHRADADPSYMGDSVGRFEGNTLIVDVSNFIDDTWLGSDGYFHSENMHVVERFTRNGDTLTYAVTVEDPAVLARPWVITPRDLKLSKNAADALLEAPPCVEQDSSHIQTLDHH
jgi:hypothetical protein